MSDEPYGGFFQFPLCLLAAPGDWQGEIIHRLFAYGVVSFLDKTEEGWRRTFATREDGMKKAQKVIKFSGGDIGKLMAFHSAGENFTNVWERAGRKTCEVRMRKDLYFSARDQNEPSERELRVLLGIYSAIGAKSYVKIGWQSIQCRTAGWLTTPPPKTPDLPCGPMYSRRQIDYTIAGLLVSKLVASVTYRRGERYWSHRLSADELLQAVINRKQYRQRVRAERAARDAQASAAIKPTLLIP